MYIDIIFIYIYRYSFMIYMIHMLFPPSGDYPGLTSTGLHSWSHGLPGRDAGTLPRRSQR